MAIELTIISTDHWLRSWFEKLIIPTSRYRDAEIEFVDISTGSFPDQVSLVRSALKTRPNAVCFACTDCAMEVYSASVEIVKQEVVCSTETCEMPKNIGGANFLSFFLATNKLACRKLVAGCDDLKFAAVRISDPTLPDLGVDGFFKPLAECGSKGVFKYPCGDTATPNPLYHGEEKFGEEKEAGSSEGTEVAALISDPILRGLAAKHKELEELLSPDIVGLVEEYVPPEVRRVVVGIDGFVCKGRIYRYCVSDNVYDEDAPEVFDCLVTPSQRLSKEEIAACWAKYETVVGDLVRRGLDNQFVDVEAFVLSAPPGGHVIVKTMEVNCRTYCNQLPMFSQLFGGDSGFDGCMLSAAVDLLRDETPSIATDDNAFSKSVLIPIDSISHGVMDAKKATLVGVCAYLPLVGGDCPVLVESESKDASYYGVPGFQAHVYAIASSEAVARKRCDDFRSELVGTYER